MKIVAVAGAVILSMSPTLSAADSSGAHGFPIENTAQAAAAVSAPLAINPVVVNVGENDAISAVQFAQTLRATAAAINPDFAAAIPPTDVPCPAGGVVTIQTTPGVELLVQGQYQACRTAFPGSSGIDETNGLVAASFRADNRITLARFGTPDAEFVDATVDGPSNSIVFRLRLRLEVRGLLLDPNLPSPVSFEHRMDGTFSSDAFFQPPSTPADLAFSTSETALTGFAYAGAFFPGPDVFGREGTLSGSAASRNFVVNAAGEVVSETDSAIQLDGVAIVDKTDTTAIDPQTGQAIRTVTWDGNFTLDNPDFTAVAGCLNGDYEVRTKKPLRVVFAGGLLSASDGRFRINNQAETLFNADQSVILKFKGETPFANFVSLQDFSGCGFGF